MGPQSGSIFSTSFHLATIFGQCNCVVFLLAGLADRGSGRRDTSILPTLNKA